MESTKFAFEILPEAIQADAAIEQNSCILNYKPSRAGDWIKCLISVPKYHSKNDINLDENRSDLQLLKSEIYATCLYLKY